MTKFKTMYEGTIKQIRMTKSGNTRRVFVELQEGGDEMCALLGTESGPILKVEDLLIGALRDCRAVRLTFVGNSEVANLIELADTDVA